METNKSYLRHFKHGKCTTSEYRAWDVNGHYEPGNVRWATMKEQQNNRRNNRRVACNG